MSRALQTAFILSIITVVYNLGEGSISVWFGMQDETLALFGFGIDSFVEVISGLGIVHMILRMRHTDVSARDRFERTALRITGTAFYLLAGGLTAGSVLNIITRTAPSTTMAGIIVSSVSILTMFFLMRMKLKAGAELGSDAVTADAKCTRACLQLSFVLLGSSLLYEIFRIPFIDITGSLVIALLCLREAREAFEKAAGHSLFCSCDEPAE
jgi:hypothetical protein